MYDQVVELFLLHCSQCEQVAAAASDHDRRNAYDFVIAQVEVEHPRWEMLILDLGFWAQQRRESARSIRQGGYGLAIADVFDVAATVYEELEQWIRTATYKPTPEEVRMLFDDLSEAQRKLTTHVEEACAALAFLEEVSPAQAARPGPIQEQWHHHMNALNSARVWLGMASEYLHDDLNKHNERVIAAANRQRKRTQRKVADEEE